MGPAAAALLLAACGRTGDATPGGVTDSAGVRLVTTGARDLASLPRWTIRTELTLGGSDDRTGPVLHRVADVRLLASGTVAVASRGTSQLLFFDRTGRWVGRVGREGDGPEEFRAVVGVREVRGDSLVALDRVLRRLTILDTGMHVARTAPLEGELATVDLVGVLGPDRVVVQDTKVRAPTGAGIEDNPSTLLVYDLDGRRLGKLGTYPALSWKRLSAGAIARPQFAPTATFGAAAGRVWVGLGRAYEVTLLDAGGEPDVIARWSGPSLEVTASERERWRSDVLGWATTGEERAAARAQLDAVVFADRKAAYDRVVASDDGGVWVRTYAPFETDSLDWLVLDGSGHGRASLRTPASLRVFDVRGGEVAATLTDELGVEHVVIGRVREG